MSVRSILCPVDFGASAEEALRYAVSLAAELHARTVYVLHVHQPAGGGGDPRVKQHAARQLEDMTKRYCAHDVDVVPRLTEGIPYEAIVEEAKRLGVDLIVMGTHACRALARAVVGSVAEHVLRHSPIAVCTVRKRG